MIGAFGEVYLLDWGIAVSLVADPSGRLPLVTESGIAGTAKATCAPMWLVGPQAISARTDVYQLGAVLYRIVVGHAPHEQTDPDLLLQSIWESKPVLGPDVPAELATIIVRAMHREPQERFASADAVRVALADYLRNRAADATRGRRRSGDSKSCVCSSPKATAPRERIYECYGQCRFGLQQARREWPNGERARTRLDDLAGAMVEHLLEQGDARARRRPSSPITPDADPAIASRVNTAVAAEDDKRRELLELEQQMDPRIGAGTRRAAFVAMGVVWTLAPLSANVMDVRAMPLVVSYLSPVVLLALALLVWWRARNALGKTAINRRFVVALLVGFCAHMVHVLSVQLAGLPARSELAMGMVSFGAIVAILAHTADSKLWPMVPLYWGGAVVGALFREQSAYVLAGCNLVLYAVHVCDLVASLERQIDDDR